MKKFLTVLLVIAVMFTFSFGSAFAAAPSTSADKVDYATVVAKIEQAHKDALKQLQAEKTEALDTLFGGPVLTEKSFTISSIAGLVYRSAVAEAYEDVYKDAEAFLYTQYQQVLAKLALAQAAVDASETDPTKYYAVDDTADAGSNNGTYDGDTVTIGIKFSFVDGAKEYVKSGAVANAYTAAFSGTSAGTADNDVAQATLEKLASDTITAFNKSIDETEYSDNPNGNELSDREKVATAKNEATYAIQQLVAGNTTWAQIFTATTGAVAQIEAIYTPAKGAATAGGTLVNNAFTASPKGIKGISKSVLLPSEDAKLAYAKNLVLKTLLGGISDAKTAYLANKNAALITLLADEDAKQSDIDLAYKAIADGEEYYAAAKEIVEYLVNDAEKTSDLIADVTQPIASWTVRGCWGFGTNATAGNFSDDWLNVVNAAGTGTNTYNATKVLDIVEHVADLKDEAALLKETIKIDGDSYVNIDALLEDAIEDTYYGDINASLKGVNADYFLLDRMGELLGVEASGNKDGAVKLRADQTVKINGRLYKSTSQWDANLNTYYEDNKYAEVRKITKEAEKEIRAAKTIEEADAAFLAGYEKFVAVPKKTDRTAATIAKAFTDLRTKYDAEIDAYVGYKYAGLEASKELDKYPVNNATKKAAFIQNLKDTMNPALNNDLYSVDDLTAAYEAAKAVVDGLKTTADIQAAYADLTKKVADAKTLDKAAIAELQTAVEDHNDYCELVEADSYKVLNTTVLDKAFNTIKDAEAKAVKDAVAAIWKDGKVTVDEAQAVADANAAYDAYVEYYSDPESTTIETITFTGVKSLSDANKALWKAQVANVEQIIAKLPAYADAASVKVALDAYNALSMGQKQDVDRKMTDKLEDMVKYTTLDDENAKAYVQDLSIKARSTKTSKGVKVTIKADVQELLDNGYTVEYKFYRSTKSNKNFGKAMITKTEGTYTNTKGVKGTKYYYKAKLVVKNAAGEVVATTPLTQCLYATRTL